MKKFLLPVGATALMALAPVAFAQTSGTNSQQNNSARHNNTSQQDNRAMASADVDSMLHDINLARMDSKSQDKNDAMKQVNAAISDLQNAEQVSANQNTIPLFTETDQYSVIGPIMAERVNKKSIPSPYENNYGNAVDRSKLREDRKAKTDAVTGVVGSYTDVTVNLQTVKTNLQKAQQDVESNNLQAADQDLKRAEDSVNVQTVAADLPLLRARENLMLARSAASSGDYMETQAALRAAANALGNYAKVSQSHSSEAKSLESQIRDYHLNSVQQDQNATSKIQNWWSETTEWSGQAHNTNTAMNNMPAQR